MTICGMASDPFWYACMAWHSLCNSFSNVTNTQRYKYNIGNNFIL